MIQHRAYLAAGRIFHASFAIHLLCVSLVQVLQGKRDGGEGGKLVRLIGDSVGRTTAPTQIGARAFFPGVLHRPRAVETLRLIDI